MYFLVFSAYPIETRCGIRRRIKGTMKERRSVISTVGSFTASAADAPRQTVSAAVSCVRLCLSVGQPAYMGGNTKNSQAGRMEIPAAAGD